MQDITFCTISLKKFNIMSLIYPLVFALIGACVAGVPLGLIAGLLDTLIFKNGVIVDIALWIFGVLWAVMLVLCFISFFKVIDELAKTIDALCVGDGKQLQNIWIVLLLNIVTIGIYKFIYFYKLQQRLESRAHEYNEGVLTSPSNLLLFTILSSLVGFGFLVAAALIIEDANQLVYISNDENTFETKEYQNWGIQDLIRKLRYRY